MKRSVFILSLFMMLSTASYSQFVVDEAGRVALGDNLMSANDEPLPLHSDFSINSPGENNACMYVNNPNNGYGIKIHTPVNAEVPALSSGGLGNRSIPDKYGVFSQIDSNSSYHYYAIYGRSYNPYGNGSGYNYGVYGIAGNGYAGYNYGVFGSLYGTSNGAGVYGSSYSNDTGVGVTGKYAGYFRGNVYVTGTVNGVTISPSDYRLKKNIENIPEGTLDDIRKMNVVRFDYKQREVETDSCKSVLYDEKSPILTHKHYGLIAQELQKIYPDLVVEGDDGYLAVNYTEIIPLLIRSVQELSARLDAAEKNNARRSEGTTDITNLDVLCTTLYQNNPNPFTEKTTIACTIAETVRQATLYIYDMNGKQIAVYPVAERGDAQVVIEGNSLDAGMYMYSLIADSNVIDTKRMILTK